MNARDQKRIIKEFYTMMVMVGLTEGKGNTYVLPVKGDADKTFLAVAHSSICPVTIEALGGKLQALKLLRACEVVKVTCQTNPETFGVLSASFLRVVEEFPILRSYYEMAKIGAAPHTWYRHKRSYT